MNKSFNLNTQRIVNFRVNQGKNIYLYGAKDNVLYYINRSLNEIRDNLGIHPSTCIKGIKKVSPFFNFFKITNTLYSDAKKANMPLSDLLDLIAEKKKTQFLKDQFTNKLSVPITASNVMTKEIIEFSSIKEAVSNLKSINVNADINKIAKIINSGEEYKGFTWKGKK